MAPLDQLLLPPLLALKALDGHRSPPVTVLATTEKLSVSPMSVLEDSQLLGVSWALQNVLSCLRSKGSAEMSVPLAAKEAVEMPCAPNKLWLSGHQTGLFSGTRVVIQRERPSWGLCGGLLPVVDYLTQRVQCPRFCYQSSGGS